MKVKVLKKDIKKSYNNIITIGYCNAYYLLVDMEPDYYTCGVYGWDEDIYKIDYNTIITTGYRPIDGIRPSYELIKKYNEKARKIYNKAYSSIEEYNKNLKKIEKLRNNFIKEVIDNED